jgi:alpha-pyrone synthase
MAVNAYINRIGKAVPPHDVHRKFLDYAPRMLGDPRARRLFRRMADRAQIAQRYSVMAPSPNTDQLDAEGLFQPADFPGTKVRMGLYERHAPQLAMQAIAALQLAEHEKPTHIIVTTCTGLHAPGIDLAILDRLGLDRSVERTVVGFMGCYAAINGLKLARHIVRSAPEAIVLMVNVELCTLHLQWTDDLESLLSFMIFADGCAASLVTANATGLEIIGFDASIIPDSGDQITWRVGDQGFDMRLAGTVPAAIGRALPGIVDDLQNRFRVNDLSLWAVHPGGRTILDAVEASLRLPPDRLSASREVLRRYGNMSSPSIMFVLQSLMQEAAPGEAGAALAFGPGLTAETMMFRTAGHA